MIPPSYSNESGVSKMLVSYEKGWVDLDEVIMMDERLQVAHLKNGQTIFLLSDECKAMTALKTEKHGGIIFDDSIRVLWDKAKTQKRTQEWVSNAFATFFDDEYKFTRDMEVSSIDMYGYRDDNTALMFMYTIDDDDNVRRIDFTVKGWWHELEFYEQLMVCIQNFVYGYTLGEDDDGIPF
jgi:hypothetical protein